MGQRSRLAIGVGVVGLCGLLVQEAWAVVPVGPSDVYVQGTQLMVRKRKTDGSLDVARPYIIKGLTWSAGTRAPAQGPNPLNPTQTVPYGFFFDWPSRVPQGDKVLGFWLQEEVEARYLTDLASIASMSANTVRLYDEPNSDPAVSRLILDTCYERGIMVIMTVAGSKADLDTGRHLTIVNRYKDHPAILMWSLGNEWNLNLYYGYPDLTSAANATQQAAQAIASADSFHPVSSSLGDIPTGVVGSVPAVEIWGLNVYRGINFGNLFAQWQAQTSKPFYLGEFGTDSFRSTGYRVVNG